MNLQSRWNAERARRWLRGCAQVGADPHLVGRPTIYVYGGEVRIGDRLRLASSPVPSHLVAGPGAALTIEGDVSVGCGAAIAAFQRVHIGEGTHIGPFAIIMDTNFHSGTGGHSIQHDCRPVTIGKGCRIGSRVTITRGVTIGDGAEILAGSVVSSAIPAGACAAGARARIIGVAGDLRSRWDSAAAALPDLLMASLELESQPNIDSTAIPAHLWTQASMEALIRTIDARFGVTLASADMHGIASFADVAEAVQRHLDRK